MRLPPLINPTFQHLGTIDFIRFGMSVATALWSFQDVGSF
jgi:hypothetical protein